MRRSTLLKLKPAELKQLCQSYGMAYAAGSKETREEKLVRRRSSSRLGGASPSRHRGVHSPRALPPRSRFWWSGCCAWRTGGTRAMTPRLA